MLIFQKLKSTNIGFFAQISINKWWGAGELDFFLKVLTKCIWLPETAIHLMIGRSILVKNVFTEKTKISIHFMKLTKMKVHIIKQTSYSQ